jgi:hypothetical protein
MHKELDTISFSAMLNTAHAELSEATRSSEPTVAFQQTAWRYDPGDRTLHNHCFENLKS